MSSSNGGIVPSSDKEEPSFRAFLQKLRKRRIIETLAAFIGGGWLLLEFVHWILVDHYHFPEKIIDITFVTILGTLICSLLRRWFSGREKPRKLKPERVLIPLVLLITILMDINLLFHLKEPGLEAVPAPNWKNSIAVLPFVDMSPQKDQEYFCDGMTEDLINRLSNIKDLKVPARTSAFMFKGKTPDMRDVGEKLNVHTALEGSVQKSGNRLRITAQLINIADGYHLWSEQYDRELKDVFVIQDEISSAIVEALRLKLTAQEKRRIEEHPIDDAAAYECYLKASYEILRFKKGSLDRVVQDLQNAIDIIGPNPLLYSALGVALRQYVNIGAGQEDYIARAEDYAKKALALDPNSSKANVLLASLFYYKDLREGIPYLKKALAMNPSESGALLRLVYSYLDIGRISAARHLIDTCKRINPLDPENDSLQGAFFLFDGQFNLALEPFSKYYQSDPQNPVKQFAYALILAYNNAFDEAFVIIDHCAQADPNNALCKFGLLLKYGILKEREKAGMK